MNSRTRWREVIRVTRREEVLRTPTYPDWTEWGPCWDCGVGPGMPCYDVLGTTRRPLFAERMGPHERRVAKGGGAR